VYYAPGAYAKEVICYDCLEKLLLKGIVIERVEELLEWMKSDEPATVLKILDEVGYQKCCFQNEIDAFHDELVQKLKDGER
jgi:site-specific DNA-cytosine methylase